MKTTHLNRIGVVVKDLDKAISEYQRLYRISTWERAEVTPEESVSHGRKLGTAGSWRSAIGTTTPVAGEQGPGGRPASGLTFELIQPTGGETPFNHFRLTKGEGIAFIQVAAEGASAAEIAAHFSDIGIPVAYSATLDSGERTFYDTRSKLGGFYVEMVPSPENRQGTALTEDPAMRIQGMYHFGVLVHDVMEALPHYRDVFGIETFDMKTWEKGHGRLDDPYYRGEKRPTGYFTAQGTAGDFGFEVIEINYGDCHYNREFFDERGPGIHHFFGWMTTSVEEWNKSVSKMTDAGHGLCMGSELRGGAAEFGYFDTFDALGGYLIEIVVRRHQPAPEFMAPDYVVDFRESL